MAFLMAGAALAMQGAEVKLPGWDGAPVQFEVQERYLAARGNRTAVDFTIADEGAWAPSGAASNCVKRTDEPRPYVRFGGDDKRVGLAHGVKPAKLAYRVLVTACTPYGPGSLVRVRLFTGRTKSLGLNKSTMMPLAALIGGSFIKNPLLKIPLMLYGGASLVNKVGQEALSEYRQETSQPQNIRYRQYADEELNPRISNPHVEGNVLIVDIDHVPRIVTMPPTLADAYQSGAIPLNTLANHILAKTDQMQQSGHIGQQAQDVARQYEQGQEREQVRGIR